MDRTLLPVDDGPNGLTAPARSLRKESHRVITATSGAEGLKQLAELLAEDARLSR
ncbi:hypothetical protein [Endothiovibrio diazotrophicus]